MLEAKGDEAVVLSRAGGTDLTAGSGLRERLEGVDVVVDVTNTSGTQRRATDFFEAVAGNLQRLGADAGVRHVVTVSIVGIDRASGFGYYAAKLAHEAAATSGTVPASIVRATQFHEFPGQVLARSRRGPVALVPRMRVQSVSARAVAERLVSVAGGAPPAGTVQVAGPEERDLVDLARGVLDREGSRVRVLAVRIPGAAGRAMAAGALLPESAFDVIGPTFDEWLASA